MHFREMKEKRGRNQSHNNQSMNLDVLPPHQGRRVVGVLCKEIKKQQESSGKFVPEILNNIG